jgi:large repetitive protein
MRHVRRRGLTFGFTHRDGPDNGEEWRVTFLAARRVELLAYVVVLATIGGILYAVTRTDGYARHRADLNDGVIWVSNNQLGAFGRLNKPTDQLDGAPRIGAGGNQNFDVIQQGAAILGVDLASSTVHTIDAASGQAADGASAAVPAGGSLTINGGVLGVVDAATGKIWGTEASDLNGIPSVADVDTTSKPLTIIGKDASGTVMGDGSIVAASLDTGTLVTVPARKVGFGKPTTRQLALAGTPVLTAVGDVAVVLDTATGELSANGKKLATVAKDAVLQQVGPEADSVVVETTTDLLEVDLSSGEVSSVAQTHGASIPSPPARAGDCVFAAWSGNGSQPGFTQTVCPDGVDRGGDISPGSSLVIRSNRGQAVLNDRQTGKVWNIDEQTPQQVDNWDGFQPTEQDDQNDTEQVDDPNAADKEPKANPDTLGARPGVTSVLHVLDNDLAPEGTLLAISAFEGLSDPNATLQVSPDSQTLLLTLPRGEDAAAVRFSYTVNAGSDKTAKADVVVPVQGPDQHHAPQLRENAATDRPTYTVASTSTVTIPVLGDWRDPLDGDGVTLTSATAPGGGEVHVTAGGQLRYVAPGPGGTQKISYTVTDSDGSTAQDEVVVVVQKRTDLQAVAPTAEPDLASGVVSQPIVIHPLANDVPGSDPLHLNAQLVLAAQASAVDGGAGLQLRSDLDHGKITVVASRAGTYMLSYQAGFGDANPSTALIRVDVAQPQGAEPPVTVPDTATLFGISPTTVDVLANDFDPQGQLLVTQDAELDPGVTQPLEISVISGHWVRLRATGPLSFNPLTVHYHVTNGTTDGVSGDIVVRQADPLEDDRPVTTEDFATVRSGSAVSIPVLDNDFSPSGAAVSLSGGGKHDSGLLEISPVGSGAAYVSGRLVRFNAPAGATAPETVDVTYVAHNGSLTTTGVAHVTVTPATTKKNPNQDPTPPLVEGRVVAGDTLNIKIPTSGSDPDGDPVTVTGLGSAPSLGRVVKFGATELVYQAFPSSSGTDSFDYQVTDPEGGVATGTVRVAVTSPGSPQPPVAVADSFTAAPGRHVTVAVMSNDLVADGDVVRIQKLADSNGGKLPGGAKSASDQGPIELIASDDPKDPTVSVNYTLEDGVAPPSSAGLTVHSVEGYNNAPVVFDAYGSVTTDADSVTIDPLATAYDPDDSPGDLTLELTPGSPATVVDGKVSAPLSDQPQVLPYTVADTEGGRATAMLYVPARPAGPPRLISSDPLQMEQGGELDVNLADVVVDPAGKEVRLTLKKNLVPAPADKLQLDNDGPVMHLTALDKKYVGPASITFEVTNAPEVGAPGDTATLTLPVQIGTVQPQFRCPGPESPLTVTEGGPAITPDVVALCHVWTPDADSLAAIQIDGDASSGLAGLEVTGHDDQTLTIQAPGGTAPTTTAQPIEVSAVGTDAKGTLYVQIVKAPPPTLTPVTIEGALQGETRTIDLVPTYFHSSLSDAVPTVVSLVQTSGEKAEESGEGGAVTITPGADSSGVMTWNLTMSDVADTGRGDRQVTSTIRMTVLGVPDQPGRPTAPKAVEDGQVSLSWDAPDDNGAPITDYNVTWPGGQKDCGAANSCVIPQLTNGQSYSFQVTAHNSVGDSKPSDASAAITPDAVPGPVTGLTMTPGSESDHHVTITWGQPTKQTTIDHYVVSWAGSPRVKLGAGSTSYKPTLADNNRAYDVTVVAMNKQGYGDNQTVNVQSSGRPADPAGVEADLADGADGAAKVSVSWSHSDWEGKAGTYEVYRNGSLVTTVGSSEHSVVDGVQYDGSAYVYSVKAINSTTGPAHTSGAAAAASFKAQGTPDVPTFGSSEATGANTIARFTFTAGEVRGTNGTYVLHTAKGDYTGSISRNQQITIEKPAADNGSTTTPTVKICNAQGLCSATKSGPSVRPYGPLDNGSILSFQTDASSTSVSFTGRVDTNGRPASVHVTGNRGYNDSWNIDSRNGTVSGSQDIGYSNNETFTITVSDSGRGSGTASSTSPNTIAVPPSVTVSKGAQHSVTGCTSSSCRYIVTHTHDFPGNVTCSVTSSLGSGGFVSYGMGPNDTKEGPDVFGDNNGWVNVTCNGISSGNVAWATARTSPTVRYAYKPHVPLP